MLTPTSSDPAKPGPFGHGNGVNVTPPYLRLLQRQVDDWYYLKDVLPGGDLRDYAAVARVDFHLGGDDVG